MQFERIPSQSMIITQALLLGFNRLVIYKVSMVTRIPHDNLPLFHYTKRAGVAGVRARAVRGWNGSILCRSDDGLSKLVRFYMVIS